jgi:hypothetical protein
MLIPTKPTKLAKPKPEGTPQVQWIVGQPFDCVTTVCNHAQESRPVFAGQVARLRQSFEDPLRRHGSRRTVSWLLEDIRSNPAALLAGRGMARDRCCLLEEAASGIFLKVNVQ